MELYERSRNLPTCLTASSTPSCFSIKRKTQTCLVQKKLNTNITYYAFTSFVQIAQPYTHTIKSYASVEQVDVVVQLFHLAHRHIHTQHPNTNTKNTHPTALVGVYDSETKAKTRPIATIRIGEYVPHRKSNSYGRFTNDT